jgi:hypothetical protein
VRAVAVLGSVTCCAVLAGCGHTSHLSADDQQFCSEQADDPVKTLRGDVDSLIKDDHFASSGEAYAFATVELQPSGNILDSANIEDSGLAQVRDAASKAILDVSLATDPQKTSVDQAVLERLQTALRNLQHYCDTH